MIKNKDSLHQEIKDITTDSELDFRIYLVDNHSQNICWDSIDYDNIDDIIQTYIDMLEVMQFIDNDGSYHKDINDYEFDFDVSEETIQSIAEKVGRAEDYSDCRIVVRMDAQFDTEFS